MTEPCWACLTAVAAAVFAVRIVVDKTVAAVVETSVDSVSFSVARQQSLQLYSSVDLVAGLAVYE